VKIAVVGAGSAQFLGELGDLAALTGIGPYELALHDVDASRLAVVTQLSRRVAEATRTPCSVTDHAERAAALDGAMAVVVSVGVGQQRSIEPDFSVPASYGLRQTVADTLGIGAIMRILRTAPVLAGIADDLCRHGADDALYLNVSNPMAMSVMALSQLCPQVPVVGLCHSVWVTATSLAQLLGYRVERLQYLAAGVNHQAWFLQLEHEGQDLYPRLLELAHGDEPFAATVRADVLRRLGCYPTESSKHNAEYVPWYLPWPEQVERYDLPVNPFEQRRRDNGQWFAEAEQIASGQAAIPLEEIPSGEYAPRIIRAIVTDEPDEVYVNVPNAADWVPGLPSWGAVEVPARVSAAGVEPKVVPGLPPQCAAVNRRYLDVCDLAVRAVVTGQRDHVHHAALLDPNTSASLPPDRIAALVDELLDRHQELGYLPEPLWR